MSKVKGPSAADEKKWRADADLRTLIEAEKIKSDKGRLKAALAMKKQLMDQMKSLDEEIDEEKAEGKEG